VEFALKEWGDVFRKLPRVTRCCAGGDPATRTEVLMALLERETPCCTSRIRARRCGSRRRVSIRPAR